MSCRETALRFLDCFCSGDIAGIESLLTRDFRLHGPLYECDSRNQYIAALHADPPEPASYDVIDIVANSATIVIFYVYRKAAGGAVTIAQLFRFRGALVCETRLVFGTS